nr:hypothetical protein Iba_chr15aCG13750 [Ipomoea batatas]
MCRMVNLKRLESLPSSTDKHTSHVVGEPQNNEVFNQQLNGIVESSNTAPRVEEHVIFLKTEEHVIGCTCDETKILKNVVEGEQSVQDLQRKNARGEKICILFPPRYHKVYCTNCILYGKVNFL